MWWLLVSKLIDGLTAAAVRASEQDLNKDDISRLKGRHEALLASREALGKGAGGGGDDDFIPLNGKVFTAGRQSLVLDLQACQADI